MMAAEAMPAEGHDARARSSGARSVLAPPASGSHSPVPPAQCATLSPWVANAVPFMVKSPSQFRTAGPPPLERLYADEFNEEGDRLHQQCDRDRHRATRVLADESGGELQCRYRRFVDQLLLDVSDSARLFAMLDLSAADAMINTWNDKYHYNFWRPITAIRKADADGNPATTADTGWTPMFDPSLPAAIGGAGPALLTPPYPDHTSGANAYASSSMSAFAAFFGADEMTSYATSSRFPGEQRSFNRFSDVINEVVEARIWAGSTWSADVQAAEVGREVARYIHKHHFGSRALNLHAGMAQPLSPLRSLARPRVGTSARRRASVVSEKVFLRNTLP